MTDAALKCLKPNAIMYKVSDRDGMYVRVAPSGAISFRLDYRLNGRRETVYLGRYAPDGISLARARELCLDARRAIAGGRSPAIEKQREKRRIKEAKNFGRFGEKWLVNATKADSTRAMRRSIFERELMPVWRNRLLTEITPDDLRAHCGMIVERGAPATAIHVRDILKQIYSFAILHGEKVANPADDVGPASIATFTPKDRALSPTEIRIMFKQLEHVATLPTIRLQLPFPELCRYAPSTRSSHVLAAARRPRSGHARPGCGHHADAGQGHRDRLNVPPGLVAIPGKASFDSINPGSGNPFIGGEWSNNRRRRGLAMLIGNPRGRLPDHFRSMQQRRLE